MKRFLIALATLTALAGNTQAQVSQEKLREWANPEYILGNAYRAYAYLQVCHQVREGYLLVYINDVELERAHTSIKDIETRMLNQNPNLNVSAIWGRAINPQSAGFWPASLSGCRQTLNKLFRLSPPVYVLVPPTPVDSYEQRQTDEDAGAEEENERDHASVEINRAGKPCPRVVGPVVPYAQPCK
jgi:hypothetical protein